MSRETVWTLFKSNIRKKLNPLFSTQTINNVQLRETDFYQKLFSFYFYSFCRAFNYNKKIKTKLYFFKFQISNTKSDQINCSYYINFACFLSCWQFSNEKSVPLLLIGMRSIINVLGSSLLVECCSDVISWSL